jgi:hypothetical protein
MNEGRGREELRPPALLGKEGPQDILYTPAREERIPGTARGRVLLISRAPHEVQLDRDPPGYLSHNTHRWTDHSHDVPGARAGVLDSSRIHRRLLACTSTRVAMAPNMSQLPVVIWGGA